MQDADFYNLLNTQTQRGVARINMVTGNVTKQAQAILKDTKAKALAKAHINANIVNAYNTNADFRARFDAEMQKLQIAIVA